MTTQSVIVVREPKAEIPKAYRDLLLTVCPLAIGYASPQKDTHIDTEPFTEDLDGTISEIEEQYSKDRVFLWATANEGINEDSIQPFPLIIEGEAVKLMVMAVGEFPEFEKLNEDGENFSPEYHFVNNFLDPLIQDIHQMTDGNLEHTMKLLDKDVNKEKITAKMGPNSTVLMIPCKGTAVAVSNNTKQGSYGWGFTTDALGYEEKPKEGEKPADNKDKPKLSLKEKAALRAKGNVEPEKKPDDEKKEEKTGGSPIDPKEHFAKVLKNDCFVLDGSALMARPRPGSPWKEAKTWWNTHCLADRPEDAKLLYKGFPVSQLRPTSPLQEFIAKATGTAKPEPKKADSDQAPKNVEQQRKTTGATLFIPADQKKKFTDLKNAGKLPAADIDTLKAKMAEYPPASKQLGIEFSDVLMMSPEAYMRIVHDVGAQTAICLLHESRCQNLELTPAETKPTEKPADAPVTEKPTEGKKLSLKEKAALRKVA